MRNTKGTLRVWSPQRKMRVAEDEVEDRETWSGGSICARYRRGKGDFKGLNSWQEVVSIY